MQVIRRPRKHLKSAVYAVMWPDVIISAACAVQVVKPFSVVLSSTTATNRYSANINISTRETYIQEHCLIYSLSDEINDSFFFKFLVPVCVRGFVPD
jgi:hypothetical protein